MSTTSNQGAPATSNALARKAKQDGNASRDRRGRQPIDAIEAVKSAPRNAKRAR
jgi:hypothetical protein